MIDNDYGYFLINFCIYDKTTKDTICDNLIAKFYILSGKAITYPQYTWRPFVFKMCTYIDSEKKRVLKLDKFDLQKLSNPIESYIADSKSKTGDSPPFITFNSTGTYTKYLGVNEKKYFDLHDFMTQISTNPGDTSEQSFNDESIIISEILDENIYNYYYAINGFQFGFSKSNLIRMIYLSAVTITTVGFGDIVPITDIARVLVASEAVLGIIIIGLFLNSLASKIKNDRI